jgi:hypothetical protein
MSDGSKTTQADSAPGRTLGQPQRFDRRHHMKFVWVNGRLPHPQSFCATCRKPVEETYLRDIATRLYYCGQACLRGHRRPAAPRSTKSSHSLFWPLNL